MARMNIKYAGSPHRLNSAFGGKTGFNNKVMQLTNFLLVLPGD